MKLLLAVATKTEIRPFISHFGLDGGSARYREHDISVIITGVGMVATAYSLGKHLAGTKYDLAINGGIAGSFNPLIRIGEVVAVNEDHFAELGAENDNSFITIDELGFGQSRVVPIAHSQAIVSDIKHVKAITINTVHGNTDSIERLVNRLHPEIETMEGAAFFYSCNDALVPSVQIRSVSNMVEQRNTGRWDINLAINNLNNYLIKLVGNL